MRWLISIAAVIGLISTAYAGDILPNGTYLLTDPSTSQSITLTVRGSPGVTFSAPVPLQCGITPGGTAVATATLINPPTNNAIAWTLTGGDVTDFTINTTTGVITTVDSMPTICPTGGTPSITATASD